MKNVKPDRTLINLTCRKGGDVSAPSISGLGNTEKRKVYSLLEKLDSRVHNANSDNYGYVGLGTSNLLSMACEMLLNSDSENSSFMLIEEPEAHIHAQRQLKMMQSLQEGKKNQQIIMTTHSLK